MKKLILLLIAVISSFNLAHSQAGQLDSSFGKNGMVKTGSNHNDGTVKQVLMAPGGIFNVIFYYGNNLIITKNLSNGSLDSNYGHNGFSSPLNFEPINGLIKGVLQPDGKIVMAGGVNYRFREETRLIMAVSRFTADGRPDSTFSDDGLQTVDFGGFSLATSVAIQGDGKVVLGGNTDDGNSDFNLARINIDGSLDSSFSDDGKQTTDFNSGNDSVSAIITQNNGKIVVIGSSNNNTNRILVIARYNSDGSLDRSFSGDGKQSTGFGSYDVYSRSLAVGNDGKIVVSGTINTGSNKNNFVLARYNSDGSLDNSFNGNGKEIASWAGNKFELAEGNSVAVQTDGKIIVGGSVVTSVNRDFALARYNTDGTPDKTFAKGGTQTTDFASLNNFMYSVSVENDGKITGIGRSENDSFSIARYTSNGRLDDTFNDGGKLSNSFLTNTGGTIYTSGAIQSDGKIVAAGYSFTGMRRAQFALARYNSDGSLDNSFSGNVKQTTHFGFDAQASSVAIQNDGKIVVGDRVLVRYNTDGSFDSSFAKSPMNSASYPNSIAIQSDNKIVVAGGGNVSRYEANGGLDQTFLSHETGIHINDVVAIQRDGKIVWAGGPAIQRYYTNGTFDNTFSKDGKITIDFGTGVSYVDAIAIQNDEKIVVAGHVDHYPDYYLAIKRYNKDGSVDTTFAVPEKKDTTNGRFSSVAIQSDGKILVSGPAASVSYIRRYNTDGNLDISFAKNGIQTTEFFPFQLIIGSKNLYAVGSVSYPFQLGTVARFLLDSKSNTPPIVTLTTPANNTTRLAPASIKLTAAASDTDGTISKVEFYNGTDLLHTEYKTPYGFQWKDVPVGNYTLTAKAYDNSGLVATSAPVHISVVPNKPPIVSIIKPQIRQTVAAPGYIHLEADAKDEDGRIARVEFYNGSTLIRTEYKYPYTYVWKNVPIGTYTITAVAVDNWAAQTTSTPVTIRVVTPPVTTANKPSFENDKAYLDSFISITLNPNPVNDILTIHTVGLQPNKEVAISVISSSGTVMKTVKFNSSSKTIQLYVSKLASGVYSVKMVRGDIAVYKQFVKL